MTYTNPMICVWLRPTKMNMAHCNHNAWMSIWYNTKSPLMSYFSSNHAKNHSQLSVFSPFVKVKSNGNNWLFPSQPIAIIKVSLYFPYKCVPSILSTNQQCLNPSIDGWNIQKTRWNIFVFSIIPGNVFEITTHPGFSCSKAMKKYGSSAYDYKNHQISF